MQFSSEKKTRKKKIDSFTLWVIDSLITIDFFVCLQMFIMQQRKKGWN